jgi:hypothetical protein
MKFHRLLVLHISSPARVCVYTGGEFSCICCTPRVNEEVHVWRKIKMEQDILPDSSLSSRLIL